jgi:hypothetical protein
MKMKKFLNKHLPSTMVIIWVIIITAVILFASCMPEGYKKDVVWHRITNVEVINMLSTTPPFERYKLTIDDTIKYISIKEYHVGDSVPFIYITPNNIIK